MCEEIMLACASVRVASVRARRGEFVGEVENYQDIYRLLTSAARRGSSSSWLSGSAEGSGRPPMRA
jgi:hypothetical protein